MCVVRVHLAFSLSRVAIVILFVSKGASSVRDGTVIDFDVSGDLNFARGSLRLIPTTGAAALFLHIQEKGSASGSSDKTGGQPSVSNPLQLLGHHPNSTAPTRHVLTSVGYVAS